MIISLITLFLDVLIFKSANRVLSLIIMFWSLILEKDFPSASKVCEIFNSVKDSFSIGIKSVSPFNVDFSK